MVDVSSLENQLDSFDPEERRGALLKLASTEGKTAPESTNVNMHCHSFFSYNAFGWSPTHIAWEAHKRGLYAAALCDFDVIDGMVEFLDAGETLGLRTCVNVETRAFLKEYADKEINSPGEPGVTYVMGVGFAKEHPEGSPQAKTRAWYRNKARERNIALMERINPQLPEIAIDYEKDVLPITPTGSATERHIVSAYVNRAQEAFKNESALVEFWSKVLGKDADGVCALLADRPNLEEIARAKLVKRGGLGYAQPSEDTFPPAGDFLKWVHSCDAVPMATWLDGTSDGEVDGKAMIECMAAEGAVTLNIIPDRNWNLANQEEAAVKHAKLKEIIEIANAMHLPINIGTEMNKLGQKIFDDLDVEALKPFKEILLKGARILVGHSILLRYAEFSYAGDKADSEFGEDVVKKNAFFEAVGALPPLTRSIAEKLKTAGPEKSFACFHNSAQKHKWAVE